ncbi:MAG: PepSY domain-containing protein [Gammaproteobacteria bacterium]|nr:PepSY domain-containing protein [Gammaproteobacteria bacterium]
MNIRVLATMLTFAAASSLTAAEPELPPQDARPLSEIIDAVESQGFVPVEVEFEEGQWEITAFRDGTTVIVYVDPHSASVSASHDRR